MPHSRLPFEDERGTSARTTDTRCACRSEKSEHIVQGASVDRGGMEFINAAETELKDGFALEPMNFFMILTIRIKNAYVKTEK